MRMNWLEERHRASLTVLNSNTSWTFVLVESYIAEAASPQDRNWLLIAGANSLGSFTNWVTGGVNFAGRVPEHRRKS